MIKKILTYRLSFLHKALLLLGLFLALGTTTTFAQFAVSEDFRGSGNPDIIIGDDAILTSGNPDPVNGGWLRLTPAATYKKGHAYVNKTFPSSLGVLVDFEFKTWRNVNGDGADGIGVFLFDGTASPFTLGGFGGSLGYAPNGGSGLKGGYVGIGLDEYGNFSNPSEGRVGGPGVRPNAIVMRGITTTNAATTNPFLAGTTISISGGNFIYGDVNTTTNNDRAQNILDYNTVTATRPTDNDFYRRIQLEIERLATGGQYKITVRWKTKTTDVAFTDIASYITTDVPPALLKIGFGAATGGDLNFHEIRNLLVTTPNNMRVKKTANKDFIRTVAGSGSDNQITYKIEVTNDTPDNVFNINFVDELTDVNGNVIPIYSAFPAQNGFQITSITSTGFTSGTLSQTALTNRITGTMGMAANSTAVVTVTGTLRNYLPAGGFLVNTATATPPLDNDLNNNTSRVDTPVLVEGIDFATTHSVNQNCASGSNTFTINVANIGVVAADIGGSSGKKLSMAIDVPSTAIGFTYTAVNTNGWNLISTTTNNFTNITTRTYESTQTATVSSGGAYNYPIVYTVTKSAPTNTAYNTKAVGTYFNTSNNSNAETGTTSNNTASVSIVAKPSAPTTSTSNYYYCQGTAATALTANVTPLSGNSLKWYFDQNGGFSSDYAPIPQTNLGGKQSFWVTQTNGTCESDRTQIDVYVLPTPTEGSITGDQYYCNASKPTSNLTSNVDGDVGTPSGFTPTKSYRWESSTDNATWSPIANGTITNKNYNFPNNGAGSTVSQTTYYRRITITTYGGKSCESPASNTVAIVISSPTPGTIGTAQTICYNTAPAQLGTSGTAPTGAGTMSFKWEYSSPGNSGPWTDAGVTTETYAPGALTANTYFRRTTITTNGTVTCTSSPSTSILITVLPQTNPGTIGSDQAICSGARPSDLTGPAVTPGSGFSVTYRWEYATASTGPWNTLTVGTPTAKDYSFPTSGTGSSVTTNTYYRRVAVVTQTASPNKVCETPSNSVLVSIQTPQPGTIGTDQTICKGTQPALLNSVTGGSGTGPGTVTYQWYTSTNATPLTSYTPITTNGTSESYQPGNLTNTTYYYRITKSTTNGTSCQSGASNPIKITPVDAPQPGSLGNTNQTICNGGTPTTITSSDDGTIQGTGGNLTYQWEQTTTPSNASSWTLISTATSKTYTPPAGLTQTTYYRRYSVANYPTSTCRSSSPTGQATVNVSQVPTSGTIKGDITVCSGYNGSVQVTEDTPGGGSSGPTYIWESSPDNTPSSWTVISGQSNPVYQVPTPITSTRYYRRTAVTNWNGAICTAPLPSNVVAITVPVFQAGSIGTAQTICSGTSASLTSITPGSGGTSYQWQSSPNGTSGWTDISGATADTYQTENLTSTTYYQRITVNGTCRSNPTSSVKITVTAAVNGGLVASNQTICYGTKPLDLTSTNAGATTNYRWDYSTDGGSTWSPAGATSPGYAFPATLTQSTLYRRATISGSCEGYANIITITVLPETKAGSLTADQLICSGTAPGQIGPGTLGSGSGVITYRWESSPNGTTGWLPISGANLEYYTPPAINATTYYRRITISTNGSGINTVTCEAPTDKVTVTTKGCALITNPMIYQRVKN